MMQRSILALAVGGALVTGNWLLAGPDCAKTAGATACGSKSAVSAKCSEELSKCPTYTKANELIGSMEKANVKLAAMTDADKATFRTAYEKVQQNHPAAGMMQPTMEYVAKSIATAAALDKACAAQCASKATAAGELPSCPIKAAAMIRMEKSVALVAKANELMTAVAGGKAGCGSSCAKTAAMTSADKGECAKAKAEATAAGEGCPKAKEAAMAKAEGASECAKEAAMVKADGGCQKSEATTVKGEAPCAKSLMTKAEQLIAESGNLLAQWQGVSIQLASMDDTQRQSVNQAAGQLMASCPKGSLMPETMATVQELLTNAVKLSAQCQSECAKNPEMAKGMTDEMKQMFQTRTMVIHSALNVLEKMNGTMKPARPQQMAAVN